MTHRINTIRTTASLALAMGLAVVSPAAAKPSSAPAGPPTARAAQAEDEAVVLPSRVAVAIRRTERALGNAENHIDEGEYQKAVVSLRSVRRNMYRADRAAMRQLTAVPVDPEAETTPGPDAVIAVLALEHEVVVSASGLFDTTSKGVVDGLTHAIYRTIVARDHMLDAIIGLDPEGAGAAYADGMPDTAGDYPDEVDYLTEALQDDQLSPGGGRVLRAALTNVRATAARFDAAFGGGE
jgi:hypothetical protein